MGRGGASRILIIAAAALFAAACASTPKDAEKPGGFKSGGDAGAGGGSVAGAKSHPDLVTVYFDFDSSAVRPDARSALKSNARAIGDHGEWTMVVVEGNCDERGSEEYNLALGQRRAESTKRYLVGLGIPAAKIRTVSYGESRPAARGHDEAAWAKNRRADFRVK